MNTYSAPTMVSYGYGNLNFVSGAGTFYIKPPPRLNFGRVEDIHVNVTTLFTQTTTPAYVRVGTSGDNDKYAELNMGAAAASTAYNLRDNSTLTPIKSNINMTADGISAVEMRVVAPTGGSPAGVGYLTLVLSWWA